MKMPRQHPVFRTIAYLTLLLFFLSSARRDEGQVAGATLSGVVTDPTTAVVAEAKISIKDMATGVIHDVASDRAGLYTAPNLPAGKYVVTVDAPGFSHQIVKGLVLSVGEQRVLNLALQVGSVGENVEVSTTQSTVELGSTSLSGVLDPTTVRELPLNGRSWTDLAALQPGVVTSTNQSSNVNIRGNRGYGNQLSVSGARPQQNNYRLDGISLNDYSNSSGSVLGGNLGVDSIQEFSVITTNYTAEYGKVTGGVINAITRSGTNTLHGNAYAFQRSDRLDAKNYFDTVRPPFHRFQFGGSAGAPIKKDKTFLFGDYEGVRQAKGVTTISTVPSAKARQGILSTGNVAVDPFVQKYLQFYPLPNRSLNTGGDTGSFAFTGNYIVNEDFVTGRFDHKLSTADSFGATYQFDRSTAQNPDAFNNVLLAYFMQRQLIALEETHNFHSGIVNVARFGFTRNYVNNNQNLLAINPLSADPSLGTNGNPAPGMSIQGNPISAINPSIGSTGSNFYRFNTFQASDDAFFTRGRHFLRFGVNFERDQLNQASHLSAINGAWTFGSLKNFLTNTPATVTAVASGTALPEAGVRQSIVGVYVQDDWKLRPNLTANLGLRYEIATSPVEVNGKIENLVNLTDATPRLGGSYYTNPTLKNFEPRVGIAWDPYGKATTSVRAAFGIYDAEPLIYETQNLNLGYAPFTVSGTATVLPQGSFPTGSTAALTPQASRYVHVQANPPRNYMMAYNANIQQQMSASTALTVAYVGSHGVHNAFRSDEADIILPTAIGDSYVWPKSGGKVLNQNAGSIRYVDWSGGSHYNSLQVGLNHSMSRGFQSQVSFTWGQSIDTGSSIVTGDGTLNAIPGLPFYDARLRRGLSDFNVSRTLVLSEVWQIPDVVKREGVRWIANGWQIGTITTAKDGIPFTPLFSGDPLGMKGTNPFDIPDRIRGGACSTAIIRGRTQGYVNPACFTVPVAPNANFASTYCNAPTGGALPQCINMLGNAGRNSLVGPGMLDVDLSIYKNNSFKRISETFRTQIRVEAFNVINRANFAAPNGSGAAILTATGAPSPTAGLLTGTTTDNREIQIALKVVW